MSNPYVPNRDADLDVFAANFADLITASPTTYGLVAGDAATIQGLVDTWHTSYMAATNLATRGPMTIAQKDDDRIAMLLTVRPYAQQIANNGAVLTADKVSLGLNPRTNPPTKVAPPATLPVLSLSLAQPMQHLLRYKDSAALAKSKAKPAGATALLLFGVTSTTVISNQDTLPFLLTTTKSPVVTTWSPSDVGKMAYYAGRWVNRKGQVGPWGSILTAIVP